MKKHYDAAVIGAGVFGVWTALQLRRAGLSVALIDAHGAGNSRSSSGDESRIIRLSYGAQEIYTRWAQRSLTLWREFCAVTSDELFVPTGVLFLARAEHEHSRQSVAALQHVGAPFELLARAELERRFPPFVFGDIDWAIYEPESGVLMAGRAVQAVARAAVYAGVEFIRAAVAPPAGAAAHLASIATNTGERIDAGVFVFACGPWLPKLFPALLAERLRVTRQEVCYFGAPAGDVRFAPPLLPTWIDFEREIYGLPDLDGRGCKVALDRRGAAFDPDIDERLVGPETPRELRGLLADRLPALAAAPLLETRVCQYENTADHHFIIDRHPAWGNVWIVGGGSGHGFKHGPALGEYVAARIIDGGAVEPCFTLSRER